MKHGPEPMRPAEGASADQAIWRTASALFETHGENAPRYALQCVDLALEVEIFLGQRVGAWFVRQRGN